jgi:hypothetical protein
MDKVVLALVASSFSLGAAAAPQNQTPVSAAASQNAGVRAFEEGRYGDAAEQFSDAYRIHPQPLLLLSIAKSRYKLRQFGEAKQCLFDFLRDDPNGVAGSEAFDLLTRIEKEGPTPQPQLPATCLTKSPAAAPDKGQVAAAPPKQEPPGKAVAATKEPAAGGGPTPAPKDGVTAKEPAAVAVASDKPTAGSVAVTDKTPASPAVAGEKKPVPAHWDGWQTATRSGETPSRKSAYWGYSLLGASAVAAGAGVFFGAKNLSATSDWRAARTPEASAAAADRARSAARSANIAWAATAALAGTGLGLLLFARF